MSNLAEEKRFTYADYIKWGNKNNDIRYELIDGIAYAMASPSPEHQAISGELHGQLWQFLKGKPCKIYATLDVRLNADNFDDIVVQPDLLIVCDKSKINGRSIKGTPDMIIEILSPSNTSHDIKTKFILYQRVGVKEYWIADPFTKTVQVYILRNGKYSKGIIYRDDDIIPVNILAGCEINLADVFIDDIQSEYSGESRLKQRLIEAMQAKGISEADIQDIIKNFDD